MIRLFAAVAVPYAVAERLRTAQTGLREARWRPSEAFHITLRFFGDVQERAAEDVDSALAAISVPRFDLSLRGAGSFGDNDHMRAVWAGVAESEPLHRLAGKCETAARRARLKPEGRHFKPHVTLAYLPRTADLGAVGAWTIENLALKSEPFAVDAFGLYSSHSTPDGSRYELERRYPLS